MNGVIPFYGGTEPKMFEIERRCMDRDGVVVRHLDEILPEGRVLDIGAGNGFVASALSGVARQVVALEPDPKMVDTEISLVWSRGVAQAIPFHDNTFHAAYSTWAFFLPGIEDRLIGLAEASRVVKPNGPIVIVDNAGNDEFTALANRPLSDDGQWYLDRGFEQTILLTSFRFDSVEEARVLLGFYFGEEVAATIKATEIEYRVAAYFGRSGRVG